MKGPYERLKYDLRRVWECPDCRHHERSSGAVVTMFCRCQKDKDRGERVAMKLTEEGARRILAVEDAPVASQPPAAQPPAAQSPATESSATESPATESSATESSATESSDE